MAEMIVLDDFEKLKRDVEKLQTEHDRAAGALDQLMKRLRKEFGCKTLEEAEALLEKYQRKERAAAKDWNAKREAWRKKWRKQLEKVNARSD